MFAVPAGTIELYHNECKSSWDSSTVLVSLHKVYIFLSGLMLKILWIQLLVVQEFVQLWYH